MESKKVVMSINDEDGFRAWQILKRFKFGLAARHGIVMAEFSGMVQKSQKQRKRKPTTRVPQSSSKMSKTIDPDCVKVVNADDGWKRLISHRRHWNGDGRRHAEQRDQGGSREQEARGVRDCDLGIYSELGREVVSGRQSRGRDPEHHCPGMGSKQGPH